MKNRFNLLATCLFVSSSILITPQVSLAKETTSSNFLTKIFSSKSSSQSDKTEIFKTDIDSLNIQNLDDFEFSIQDILRNYFDKKTVSQFLNNISFSLGVPIVILKQLSHNSSFERFLKTIPLSISCLYLKSASSTLINIKLESEGSFTASGDIDSDGDVPGLYITDATSPVDSIVAVRAFSNDNNPWTQNGSDLETQASTVTIGNLVFNGKIEIDGLSVTTEFGAIADVFTHKLPITIDGQTYFVCLNKPT